MWGYMGNRAWLPDEAVLPCSFNVRLILVWARRAIRRSRKTNGFKTLRQRLGLTAEAIGILLGVSAQTIYNWEAGNTRPRDEQMVRIVMLRGMGKRDVDTIMQNFAG